MRSKIFKRKKVFKEKKKKTESVLIVDIRSSGVGAAIVSIGHGGVPIIIDAHRERFFFEEKLEASDFINRSVISFNNVLEHLFIKNKPDHKIETAYVFYGVPWYKTQIKNLSVSKKEPFTFSHEYLKSLLKKTILEVDSKNSILEKEIVSISLNGYETQDPFGKSAKDVKMSFYMSVVNEETQDNFESIVKKYAPKAKIKSHTHALTLFTFLHKMFKGEQNYVLFDLSGEVTELSIVRNNNFAKFISIPHGSHYFVRGLSKRCNYNFDTAFTKLSIMCNPKRDKNCDVKSVEVFDEMKKKWSIAVKNIVESAKIESLPTTIFITADYELKELTENILNDVDTYSDILKIGRKPTLHFISSRSIENLCKYKDEMTKRDPQLSLEANFVEFMEAEK